MNELEVFEGLDLSQYQLGDIIIITGKDMLKQFRYGHTWRTFQERVQQIAKKIGLFVKIAYNEMHDEYEIHLLEDRPELNKTAVPCAEVSMSRRKVWSKKKQDAEREIESVEAEDRKEIYKGSGTEVRCKDTSE